MIYNRKNEQVTQNAKFTFSTGVSAAEKPNISNAPEDLRSFDKTKELPVLSEYDKENITPYIPVRVSKFRLRRKLREIKKSAQPKRSAAGLFISFGVCFCLCSGIIYLAFAGIYAPKEICDAVIKLCGIVYPYDGGYETTDGGFEMSGKTYVPENTPKFLSQSSEKLPKTALTAHIPLLPQRRTVLFRTNGTTMLLRTQAKPMCRQQTRPTAERQVRTAKFTIPLLNGICRQSK